MIDWSFPPELQAKYDRVLAQTRKLQAEFGIKPMTLEERAQIYEKRKEEINRRQQEIKELEQRISRSRPPPKWKV
jgi:peptidoglycan hydrolase CwlO-like protein